LDCLSVVPRSQSLGAARASSYQQLERYLAIDLEVWIDIGGEVEGAIVLNAPSFHFGHKFVVPSLDALRFDGIDLDEARDAPAALDVRGDHM